MTVEIRIGRVVEENVARVRRGRSGGFRVDRTGRHQRLHRQLGAVIAMAVGAVRLSHERGAERSTAAEDGQLFAEPSQREQLAFLGKGEFGEARGLFLNGSRSREAAVA